MAGASFSPLLLASSVNITMKVIMYITKSVVVYRNSAAIIFSEGNASGNPAKQRGQKGC